jgi:hypothetical protein
VSGLLVVIARESDSRTRAVRRATILSARRAAGRAFVADWTGRFLAVRSGTVSVAASVAQGGTDVTAALVDCFVW